MWMRAQSKALLVASWISNLKSWNWKLKSWFSILDSQIERVFDIKERVEVRVLADSFLPPHFISMCVSLSLYIYFELDELAWENRVASTSQLSRSLTPEVEVDVEAWADVADVDEPSSDCDFHEEVKFG